MWTIIVTGHTRGLGAALASTLLAAGHRVVGIARQSHTGLAQRYPEQFIECQADLADPAWLSTQAASWLQQALAGATRVALINNAGRLAPMGSPRQQAVPDIVTSVALNVTAPLALTALVLAQTTTADECRIMHIASGAGRSAYPGWSVYGATKAALDHHARAVAADALPGVRICSIAPGVIDTAMQAEIRATPAEQFPLLPRFMALKAEGGLMSPEVCAERLCAFLFDSRFGEQVVADLRDWPAGA